MLTGVLWIFQHAVYALEIFHDIVLAFFTGEVYVDGNQLKVGSFGLGIGHRVVALLMEEILHQLRLVVYPIIYDGFYASQVVRRISQPSTVAPYETGRFLISKQLKTH